MASSSPGRISSLVSTSSLIEAISSLASASNIPPKPPNAEKGEEDIPDKLSPNFGIKLDNFASGFNSRPKSPGTPSTGVGSDERSTPRESDVE